MFVYRAIDLLIIFSISNWFNTNVLFIQTILYCTNTYIINLSIYSHYALIDIALWYARFRICYQGYEWKIKIVSMINPFYNTNLLQILIYFL